MSTEQAAEKITLDDLYRYLAESRKEWNEKMGDLGNQLGDVVEYTFVPDVAMRKFAELGYEIETAARDYIITGAVVSDETKAYALRQGRYCRGL